MILRHPDIQIKTQQEPKSVDTQIGGPRSPALWHWGCGAPRSTGARRQASEMTFCALQAPTSTVRSRTGFSWSFFPSRPCQSSQNRSREFGAGIPHKVPHIGPEPREPQVRPVHSGPKAAHALLRQPSPPEVGHPRSSSRSPSCASPSAHTQRIKNRRAVRTDGSLSKL